MEIVETQIHIWIISEILPEDKESDHVYDLSLCMLELQHGETYVGYTSDTVISIRKFNIFQKEDSVTMLERQARGKIVLNISIV